MVSAARALEVAHAAIAGKRCHDAPCDITIERGDDLYTVTFTSPGVAAAPATAGAATRVVVDAGAGVVREVRDATLPERDPRLAGLISGKRAFDVGLAAVRESGMEYDERWTTTVDLRGDRYAVTFPVPETTRAAPLRPDYAYQVWVDARTGKVIGRLAAS